MSFQLMNTFIATARLNPQTRAVAESMGVRVNRLFLTSGSVFGVFVLVAFGAWLAASGVGAASDDLDAAANESLSSSPAAILCQIGLAALSAAITGNSFVMFAVVRLVITSLEDNLKRKFSAVPPPNGAGSAETRAGAGAGAGGATVTHSGAAASPATDKPPTLIVIAPTASIASSRASVVGTGITTSNGGAAHSPSPTAAGGSSGGSTGNSQLDVVINKLKFMNIAVVRHPPPAHPLRRPLLLRWAGLIVLGCMWFAGYFWYSDADDYNFDACLGLSVVSRSVCVRISPYYVCSGHDRR